MKKWMLFLLCTVVMSQPIKADVGSPSEWAVESIQVVSDTDILDMTQWVDYHEPITRETYAYIIYQLYEHLSGGPIILGIPLNPTNIAEDNQFTDTENLYIRALKSAGLINGYPDGSFRPEQPISREEIMSLYVRLLEKLDFAIIPATVIFADEHQISDWAMVSVKQCYASGLIQGIGDGKVAPKGLATVEESLAVMARILSHNNYGEAPLPLEGIFGKIVSNGKKSYGIRYNVFGEVEGIDHYEDFKLLGSVYSGSLGEEDLWLKDDRLLFKDGTGFLRGLEEGVGIINDPVIFTVATALDTVGTRRYYLNENHHLIAEDSSTKVTRDYGYINAISVSVSWNYLVLTEVMTNGSVFTRYIPLVAMEDYL